MGQNIDGMLELAETLQIAFQQENVEAHFIHTPQTSLHLQANWSHKMDDTLMIL